MSKVKMRIVRTEEVRRAGGTAIFMYIFELFAYLEQEGDSYAGCVEGFEGSIEAVGKEEQEVLKNLFNGFVMLADHHIQKDDLQGWLTRHRVRFAPIDEPMIRAVSKEEADREITFVFPTPSLAGGLLTCTAG